MHTVNAQQNPMTRTWLWICDCGKNGWGYESEKKAMAAGQAHVGMSR